MSRLVLLPSFSLASPTILPRVVKVVCESLSKPIYYTFYQIREGTKFFGCRFHQSLRFKAYILLHTPKVLRENQIIRFPTFDSLRDSSVGSTTLNSWMMLERYTNLKEEVGVQFPAVKSPLYLTKTC